MNYALSIDTTTGTSTENPITIKGSLTIYTNQYNLSYQLTPVTKKYLQYLH